MRGEVWMAVFFLHWNSMSYKRCATEIYLPGSSVPSIPIIPSSMIACIDTTTNRTFSTISFKILCSVCYIQNICTHLVVIKYLFNFHFGLPIHSRHWLTLMPNVQMSLFTFCHKFQYFDQDLLNRGEFNWVLLVSGIQNYLDRQSKSFPTIYSVQKAFSDCWKLFRVQLILMDL